MMEVIESMRYNCTLYKVSVDINMKYKQVQNQVRTVAWVSDNKMSDDNENG